MWPSPRSLQAPHRSLALKMPFGRETERLKQLKMFLNGTLWWIDRKICLWQFVTRFLCQSSRLSMTWFTDFWIFVSGGEKVGEMFFFISILRLWVFLWHLKRQADKRQNPNAMLTTFVCQWQMSDSCLVKTRKLSDSTDLHRDWTISSHISGSLHVFLTFYTHNAAWL